MSLLSIPSSNHLFALSMNSLPMMINHGSNNKSFNGVFLPLKAKVTEFRAKCKGSKSSEHITAEEHVMINNEIRKRVEAIKVMLECDEVKKSISASAYDTAWIALIKDVNGRDNSPHFPSSLQWVIDNQLHDGSWGDPHIFVAYDRLICTLACVIVLRHYSVHPQKAEKGLEFFKNNIKKLETENKEHMTCGFETVLPSLLQLAKSLKVDVPHDFPALKHVFARRDIKLTRIPMDLLHSMPTSLLFSLESIPCLQWEKLMKLQSKDGSFFFSPSSTAFAFMQTKDQNCLDYINNVVQNFDGGVPDFYPIEFLEQLWTVDRLERLGISRYFQAVIKVNLDYVSRNWNEKGIGWTKYSDLPDLDDTSMGFRLLRLNGYEVSANVFENFEKDGEFFCMAGQSDEGTTVMFNFYRACQVQFPGETIFDKGKNFATNFLSQKQAANQILDKWVISKDLPGEVKYALDFPWYASLPRVETRFYLEQYGGGDDVWISKILFRLHKVSNNLNLELGKLDYNMCQALHRREWKRIQERFSNNRRNKLLGTLTETLQHFSQSSPCASFNILHDTWKKWLLGWQREGDKWDGEAELLVNIININGGYDLPHELELNPQFQRLLRLTNELCHQLSCLEKNKENNDKGNCNESTTSISNFEIELKMQELVQLVLCSNIDIDLNMKKTFLTVAKSFYYVAYCDSTTINYHITKVLFERVI